nr:hypothetical protein [Tanacetum cinerariifolium]
MRTLSSSNLVGESSPNTTTSNTKRRNHRHSKQPFSHEESPLDMMADQHTMAELLRAPTEGYAETIVVPPILAEHFKLKHSLINMMTSNQFFKLKKDNPHDHIHLVSKFINEFFPPSRTTNLRNEISNFQQRFDESFHEAWDHYKDLLRACPHHGFTKLHQLDTFYNALNPADEDSLNSTAGGNFLERRTQDVLTIIKNKSKVHNSRNKSFVSQVKSSDVNSSSSSEISKLTHVDNIQGYVSAAAINYNQGNFGYRPPSVANQIRPPAFAQPNVQNNQNRFSQPQGYNRGNNFNQDKSYQASILQNQVVPLSSGPLPNNTTANSKGELKAITTRSGLVLDGPFVPMLPPFINQKEDERAEETLTDLKLVEYTIKIPHPLVQKVKPPSLRNYVVHQRDPLINPLSGNTTSSLDRLLEEFADQLTLITCPLRNDDLLFDIESDLREIEYLLNHDPTKEMDSILKDLVDECNLADPNNNFVDTIPKMFINEHTLDYSSPPLYDDVDDDLVELESDNDDVYDDPFDSKEDKIKESKLLIDELDPPRSSDFLPSLECDSVLYEDFSEVDALPSTNNKDKVFNLGILIHENLFEVTIRVTPDKNVKNISISNASLILEDFNPPLYELSFYKEVPGSETLLLFSSENEEKVFNPGILTSKGVHTSLLLELSYRGPKAFKVIKIFESLMEIFPCSYKEDICILDVPCLHFYPP